MIGPPTCSHLGLMPPAYMPHHYYLGNCFVIMKKFHGYNVENISFHSKQPEWGIDILNDEKKLLPTTYQLNVKEKIPYSFKPYLFFLLPSTVSSNNFYCL